MISEQRQMFPHERLLVDAPCLELSTGERCSFKSTHIPNQRVLPNSDGRNGRGAGRRFNGQLDTDHFLQHTCVFFCEHCNTATTIHRYGRPFIDGRGYVVRRCLNDGTNRAHTNDDRERCTDKHVLLKRRQIRWNATPDASGIGRHNIEQMVDVEGQMERERQRQLERETTNVRPSDFDPDIRERVMADGRIQRITSTPGRLLGTIEYVDPYVDLVRRSTPPHARADCGGCAGYYDANGRLVKHRTLSAQELL